MTEPDAHLIGLDWGTSSLRAFLMRDGRVVDTRHADDGMQRLAGGGAAAFEHAFAAITAPWLGAWPALPVVACGMVGSAQGWREVPYAPSPADAAAIARHATTLATAAGTRVLIAPGVLHEPPDGPPDVMRGEETQVVGELQREAAWSRAACLVMPGTHSKWVQVRDGRIEAFATYMTGELFALLRTQSILGRLMAPDATPPDDAAPSPAFLRGVEQARERHGELLHTLFSARTLGLTNRLSREQTADYLSGLLIGSELVAALAQSPPEVPLVLVGEPALCRRYGQGLDALQHGAVATLGNTAPDGLWALACAAGLVAPSTKEMPR